MLVHMIYTYIQQTVLATNLATSKFLVKGLLLTASFLTTRKQYGYGTDTEKTIHWQGNL